MLITDNGRSSISPKCRDAPVVRNNQQTDSNMNNQSSKGSLPKSYSVGTELIHHGTKDDDIVAGNYNCIIKSRI